MRALITQKHREYHHTLARAPSRTHAYTPQDVGGTLIGEKGLLVMTGAQSEEWYQIHQTRGFQVFDAIPFAPFQTLL